MNSQTEIIKDKLNILDIVSAYVKLERAGKAYKGKSPFNNEKTPSFFVHPDKGFFYDFSAGFGGDVFTFIEKIERIEFPEALKILAEKAGVSIEHSEQSQKEHSEKARLFELMNTATKWYEVNLRKNKEVIEYLLKRGMTKETIIKFRLGFAKDSWGDIYDHLKSKKFIDIEIERAGLVVSKQGSGYYDRFRSRIMFPLFDERGRVVGFSGRIFGDEDIGAKYINSPEGPLFDKSKVLYGYHIAKSAISKEDYCILVEGQFDVLLSQQSGYENTVAISGTGLTDKQIEMISRFTKSIYFVLDSDNAGIKATTKNVLLLIQNFFNIRVINLPEGQDPADVIKTSKEKWDILIKEASNYLDYRMKVFLQRNDSENIENRDSFKSELYDVIYYTKDNIKKWRAIEKVASFMYVPDHVVEEDIKKHKPADFRKINLNEGTNKIKKGTKQEYKELKKELFLLIHYIENNFEEEIKELKIEIEEQYRSIFNESLNDDIASVSKEELAMSIFVIEEQTPDKNFKYFYKNIKALLKTLELSELEKRSQKIQEEIQKMQILKPRELPKELMKKSSDIRKKIDSIKNTLN